jgi:hypothetical protein
MGDGVDEIGEVVGFVWRVPGRGVPPFEDLLSLGRSECAERAAGSAPCGGGVVAQVLKMGRSVGIETGNALLWRLGGLEFGKEGDGVSLALKGASGCGKPPPCDRAENSAE